MAQLYILGVLSGEEAELVSQGNPSAGAQAAQANPPPAAAPQAGQQAEEEEPPPPEPFGQSLVAACFVLVLRNDLLLLLLLLLHNYRLNFLLQLHVQLLRCTTEHCFAVCMNRQQLSVGCI